MLNAPDRAKYPMVRKGDKNVGNGRGAVPIFERVSWEQALTLVANKFRIKDWQESKHFENHVDCASCHGTDHEYIADNAGRVPPSRCSTCHAKQFSEFIRSRHSIDWARMEQSAQYKDLPEETRN